MKRIWIVMLGLFGVASCIGGMIGGVVYLTSGLTETADGFFAAVRRADLSSARVYLSEDFRAHTDDAALAEFLGSGPLVHGQSTHWARREVRNGEGELEGEVLSDTGGVVPVTLKFVKEHDEWRIQSISRAEAGVVRSID